MSERIALLGAGALAREYIGIFGRTPFSVAYVDAAYAGGRSEVSGVPIETEWDKVAAHADHYVLAVADQDARAAMRARARALGLRPCTPLIHPMSFRSPNTRVGAGTIVTAFVAIGDAVEIGEDVLVMHNISIGHDCRVGDLSVICPGVSLSGGTVLGCNSFVGANAVTAPGVRIGELGVVAAGASCLADVPDKGFAIGSPARRVARGS
ncbi:MAG: hypothetical protein HUU30_10405 [Burkholderiaceae bacterium]|nr:hypothetical protein [Burkholderiaceae bacterium]